MLVCILECITVGWIYGTYYINDGCLISSRNLIFAIIWVHLLYVGGVPLPYVFGFLCLCCVFVLFVFVLCIVSNFYSCQFLVVPSVFYVCVVYFVLFVFVLCIVSNFYSCQFLVVPSVFCVCVMYFVLFVFVLCIVSNVSSCPFLVVPSVFYVCVVYFVLFVFVLCIVSNLYSCPFLVVPSVFCLCYIFCFVCLRSLRKYLGSPPVCWRGPCYLCFWFSMFVLCIFVCLRSVYCVQCLQLPIPGCPVGFL